MHAGHNATTARRIPPGVLAAVVGTVGVGLLAYRPEGAWPFDPIDFSEILPLLEGQSTFLARLGAMTGYYADHGRFNLLQYAGTVARWHVFGDWTTGWHLARMAVMLALTVVAGSLLRRLGATRLGAAAGGMVFLIAPAAGLGWVHLTSSEPLGTLLALGLARRALGFQERERWMSDVALAALGAAAILMLKEMLAPLILVPLLAALLRHDGMQWRLASGRRSTTLLAAVTASSLAVILPAAAVYLRAPAEAYTSSLGTDWMDPSQVVALWLPLLVPFPVFNSPVSTVWFGALLAWVATVAIGWGILLLGPDRRRWLPVCLFAMAWPLAGVAVYMPWPFYWPFYAIPYLTGTALLLAFAVTGIERRLGQAFAASSLALMVLLGVTSAQESASRRYAHLVAWDRTIEYVAALTGVDSVFFATGGRAGAAWTGPGPTLARHADATHRPWPPTRDIPCDAARAPNTPHTVTLWYSIRCDAARGPDAVIVPYRFIDWRRWRTGTDTLRVRIEIRGA